ncbi:MAG: prolipoprotein diacylglyceryl transferase [Planctomycetota bacterium]
MSTYLAEAYLHRLDPFAVELPASWQDLPLVPDGIRWYGLAYLFGFLATWLLIRWLAGTGRSPIPVKAAGDFMIYVVVGVLVGGRLGYCVFYDPHLLIEFDSAFPFWGLAAIHRGGMASHGGIAGVIIASWLFAHRGGVSKLHLLDVLPFTAPAGLFVGRLANFVNAELWGRPLPGSMQSNQWDPSTGELLPESLQADPPWWGVKYPDEILGAGFPHPEALESLRPIVAGGERFYGNIVDAARAGDTAVVETLAPLLTAYYPSQIVQAITDGPILMAVLALVWLRPRKPGVVGSWFLISYGAMRIVTEIIRQPDVGVEGLPTPFGDLSRGQVLSVVMVVAGVVALIICARRAVPPIGGLLRPTARSGRVDEDETGSNHAG